jgi:hypothetical protein
VCLGILVIIGLVPIETRFLLSIGYVKFCIGYLGVFFSRRLEVEVLREKLVLRILVLSIGLGILVAEVLLGISKIGIVVIF